jgi:hypothetical protein
MPIGRVRDEFSFEHHTRAESDPRQDSSDAAMRRFSHGEERRFWTMMDRMRFSLRPHTVLVLAVLLVFSAACAAQRGEREGDRVGNGERCDRPDECARLAHDQDQGYDKSCVGRAGTLRTSREASLSGITVWMARLSAVRMAARDGNRTRLDRGDAIHTRFEVEAGHQPREPRRART